MGFFHFMQFRGLSRPPKFSIDRKKSSHYKSSMVILFNGQEREREREKEREKREKLFL